MRDFKEGTAVLFEPKHPGGRAKSGRIGKVLFTVNARGKNGSSIRHIHVEFPDGCIVCAFPEELTSVE